MQYTGSKYYGDVVHGRMEGKCEFEFPPLLGSKYVGPVKDGHFHGDGTVHISDSLCYEGKFENGLTKEGKYKFSDGLVYEVNKDWHYCDTDKDRLFAVEARDGLNPAGRCLISNINPPRLIPEGMYDSGDGFYDPKERVLYTYEDLKFLRTTDEQEHLWIVNKCRKAEPKR